MTIDTLLSTMRQRLADAEHDAERIRAAIAVLEDTPTQTTHEAHRSSRKGRRPRATPVFATELVVALAKEPNQTTSQLAKAVDGDPMTVRAALKAAEADGTVSREGERRGTRWSIADH